MKNLFILLCLILSYTSYAAVTEAPLRTIVKFQKTSSGARAYSFDRGEYLPTIINDDKVRNLFSSMKDGEEAVIEGYINYEMTSVDGPHQLTPYFVIESIHPISLKELGNRLTFNEPAVAGLFDTKYEPFAPKGIPVTTQVASAITLTTSMLLMESLSSGSGDPSGRSDLRKALFISAGTMATLLFIYEQIEGISKP